MKNTIAHDGVRYAIGPRYVARKMAGPWYLADSEEGRAIEAESMAKWVASGRPTIEVVEVDDDTGVVTVKLEGA